MRFLRSSAERAVADSGIARRLPLRFWVRTADVVVVLLAAAVLHVALVGGIRIGAVFSMSTPWRALAALVVIGCLRYFLVRRGAVPVWRRASTVRAAAEPSDSGSAASRGVGMASRGRMDPADATAAVVHRGDLVRQSSGDVVFFRAFDFLVLAVICISYTAVAMLALSAFDARVASVAGLLLAVAVRYFLPAGFEPERVASGPPVYPVVAMVLLLALLFRVEPFLPLHGGQDQGIYTSMSAHLQRKGSAFIDDPILAAPYRQYLDRSPIQNVDVIDRTRREVLPDKRLRDIYACGLAAGTPEPCVSPVRAPGVYYSQSQGDYIFQFYHLHALWMATFADLFGDRARFYSLTFFSLLSIAAICLLVFEVTASRLATLAMGVLLAVNPLHVFFSRLHVTEVVALAFSAVGFYYLTRAARGVESRAPRASVAALTVLSALAVAATFFVRITGFLYLPLLLLIYCLGVCWTVPNRREYTGHVIGYVALVAGLYGLSVFYGLHYSPVYSVEVVYESLLGPGWQAVLLLGATTVPLVAVLWLLAILRNWWVRVVTLVATPRLWMRLATLLILIGVVGSFYEAYLTGFTDTYIGSERHERFGIVGAGSSIFWQTGVAGWLFYTSPALALLAVVGLHCAPRRWPVVLLYFFVAICLCANLMANIPIIFLHYYYARYLLSEIVPYSMAVVVVATFLAPGRWFRRFGIAAIVLTIPFHLFYTSKQMQVREGVRPYTIMSSIADDVQEGVLLFDVDGYGGRTAMELYSRLRTPLDYYFDLDLFPYDSENLSEILSLFEGAKNQEAWLLSNRTITDPRLRLVRTFGYWDMRMAEGPVVPIEAVDNWWRHVLYLYRLPDVCETPTCPSLFDEGRMYPTNRNYIYAEHLLGSGWHEQEDGHVWSSASATLSLSRTRFRDERWPEALQMEMRPFAALREHPTTLTVRSGGEVWEIVLDGGETDTGEIGLNCPQDADTCIVRLDVAGARAPSEVNGSTDDRVLGVAMERVGFRFATEEREGAGGVAGAD